MKSLITALFFTLISLSAADIYATDEHGLVTNDQRIVPTNSQPTTDEKSNQVINDPKAAALMPMSQECKGDDCGHQTEKDTSIK